MSSLVKRMQVRNRARHIRRPERSGQHVDIDRVVWDLEYRRRMIRWLNKTEQQNRK